MDRRGPLGGLGSKGVGGGDAKRFATAGYYAAPLATRCVSVVKGCRSLSEPSKDPPRSLISQNDLGSAARACGPVRSQAMPTGSRAWAAVWVLALGTFVVGTSELVMAGVLPVIARDLDIPVASAGYLVTAYALSFAVVTPIVAARLGGKVPKRLMLGGALGVFVLGTALSAGAPNYATLMLARVITAAAAGVFEVVATAAAASLVPPQQRGRAIAVVVAGFSVALVFGVPLGTLVGNAFGWRASFGALFVPALLVAVGVWLWVPTLQASEQKPLRYTRELLAALAATALVFCGNYAGTTFIAVLLEQISGVPPTGVAVALLLIGLGSIVGNALGGFGIDRWGVRGSALVGAIGMGLALWALWLLAPRAELALASCLILGAFAGVFVPAMQAKLVRIGRGAEEFALALNLAALNVGISGGAALGSAVVDRGGLASVGYVGGAIGLLAVALLRGPTSEA